MTSVRLDDPSVVAARDPGGMLALVNGLPDQVDEAMARLRVFQTPPAARECMQLVICGMGGSAIAGDLLGGVVEEQVADRIRVHRGWGLPRWVTADALVAVVSHSGNTPESLSAYDAARERDLPLVALSSGGALQRRAVADGESWIGVPGGMPPRAGIANLFFPLLRIAVDLGIARAEDEDLGLPSALRTEAAAYAPAEPPGKNRALELAQHLRGRLPLVHSGTALTHAVARRFVAQLAENAKRLAVRSEYPELTHNEVVAFDGDEAMLTSVAMVELVDTAEPRGVGVVREGVEELAGRHGARSLRIAARGASRLARLWSLVLLTDFASVYLALLDGRDPSAIEPIAWLKGRVAEEMKGIRES